LKILMTGATGMLGVEMVPRLLDHGHSVVAVVRTERPSNTEGLSYIKGDLVEELNLPWDLIDAVLHLGALTSLRQRNAEEVWNVNAGGTARLLRAALQAGVTRFFYCSSLYVAGDESRIFNEEDLGVGQWLKNPYEASKVAAEGHVRSSGVDATIFRPGILVGRHSDGHAAFFEGFYRPYKALVATHRMAEKTLSLPPREEFERRFSLPSLHLPIRVYGDPDCAVALTPVDWAAETMAKLIDEGDLRTYHIVPAELPQLRIMADAANHALGLTGFHVGPGPTRNPLDMFYNRLIRDFHPYLQNQPIFGTTVGADCPPVDAEYMERVVRYWREHDGDGARETRTEQVQFPGNGGAGDAQGLRGEASVPGNHEHPIRRAGRPAD